MGYPPVLVIVIDAYCMLLPNGESHLMLIENLQNLPLKRPLQLIIQVQRFKQNWRWYSESSCM